MANIFESYQIGNEGWCNKSGNGDCPTVLSLSRAISKTFKVLCGANDLCPALVVDNGLISCGNDTAINCNLCQGDLPFTIPFKDGDQWTFQFQQPYNFTSPPAPTFNWKNINADSPLVFAGFDIYDSCTGNVLEEIEGAAYTSIVKGEYVGQFTKYNYKLEPELVDVQQIKFNLQAIIDHMVSFGITTKSFYFKFYFKNGSVTNEFYSETFVKSTCEEVISIESEYSSLDCNDFYYGINYRPFGQGGQGQFFKYSNRINLQGSFEPNGFILTKDIIEEIGETTNSKSSERWILRASFVPEKYVRLLKVILAGKNVLINGKEFQFIGEIAKNNESSCQWNLNLEFVLNNCANNLSCE